LPKLVLIVNSCFVSTDEFIQENKLVFVQRYGNRDQWHSMGPCGIFQHFTALYKTER